MPHRILTAALGAMLACAARGQAPPQPAVPALTINLQDALERARKYSPQFRSAVITADLAHEDRVQAKAALLPSLNYFNQFIYTQPNGLPSGVFVANDGVHVYSSQGVVHQDLYAPAKTAEYQRTIAAEAVARARADIAGRGLVATVVQSYYGLVSAQRKSLNAQQSVREAQRFLDITQKQESGGEVAHADAVKARILLEQRLRDAQDAGLNVERSRIALAVLMFSDFRQDFSVVDDFESIPPLPSFNEIQELAVSKSPELRAAEATVKQETSGISAARGALLPSLSFDYFYGINANQFAIYNREHLRNLGSGAQATLMIPVWNWGASRSRVRQAQLRLEQANLDLGFTQRMLLANLNTFYLEAKTAGAQLDSLHRSADLSSESLRLTLLRYEAGEATALEVSDAQATLTLARNAYDDGLSRYRLALAEIQTLTGVL
jgi:outer membrane protein TolC